jgi:hypothetical protein
MFQASPKIRNRYLNLRVVEQRHHLLPVVLEEVPELQDLLVDLLCQIRGGGRGRGARAGQHSPRRRQQLLELFLNVPGKLQITDDISNEKYANAADITHSEKLKY